MGREEVRIGTGNPERKELKMAREGTFILDSGDTFPVLTMETVGHGRLAVPDAFGAGWGVFLVYRAHW